MAVRAVLFDLGNTLVAYYRSAEFPAILRECLRGASAAAGLRLSAAEEEALFPRAMELNKEREDFAVRPLADRLRELFRPHADVCGGGLAAACDAFLAPIFRCAKLDADAVRVLDALRERGVKTCIVSNTPWGSPADAWRRELSRHGLLERVDAAVLCVDVGWRKPHPAPFRRALEILNVPARDAVFVGDDPRWDVVGAVRAGLRPILLSPTGPAVGVRCVAIRRLAEVVAVASED
jgi:putative hydrolase of the HAD superfamily